MSYATLLYDFRDGIATITLNRPDAANTLNIDMARDLMHVSLQCSEDPDIRAVVLTGGTGKMFCAGGDLKSFANREPLGTHFKEVTTYFNAAVARFNRMDAPLIGAVNGTAAGAGMSLACSCDLLLAGESAKFVMAYTKIGLVPDGSATFFLARLVGMRRAVELVLTNRLVSAREACEWGIVTRVVPDNELQKEAKALAIQLAAGPTKALGKAKRLLYRGWTETLETQMELEAQEIAAIAHTSDAKEGIAAFIDKRPPCFTGC